MTSRLNLDEVVCMLNSEPASHGNTKSYARWEEWWKKQHDTVPTSDDHLATAADLYHGFKQIREGIASNKVEERLRANTIVSALQKSWSFEALYTGTYIDISSRNNIGKLHHAAWGSIVIRNKAPLTPPGNRQERELNDDGYYPSALSVPDVNLPLKDTVALSGITRLKDGPAYVKALFATEDSVHVVKDTLSFITEVPAQRIFITFPSARDNIDPHSKNAFNRPIIFWYDRRGKGELFIGPGIWEGPHGRTWGCRYISK